MTEYLGWVATVVFAASYLGTRADTLRRMQMIGALLWVAYGLLVGAPPVVAANVLVFGAAAWTLVRASGAGRRRRAMPTIGAGADAGT